MKKYLGETVCNGQVIGQIFIIHHEVADIKKVEINKFDKEISRLESAINAVKEKLSKLGTDMVDVTSVSIIESQMMMLEDEEFIGCIKEMITNVGVNADYAVQEARNKYTELFSTLDDEYVRERIADIESISNMLIDEMNNKHGGNTFDKAIKHNAIIIADDLSPAEFLSMDIHKILGLALIDGSKYSHISILAKSQNIPMLVGVNIERDEVVHLEGETAILDASNGCIITDPDETLINEFSVNRVNEELVKEQHLMELKKLIGQKTCTKSGKEIALYANVNEIDELDNVLCSDAEGIGLFRSEYIYIGRNDYPSEDELFKIYKKLAVTMRGKEVVIRTLDIGADKAADYLGLAKEANPAIGFRGIRYSLSNKELFIRELRAILRAAVFGNVSIMYPMITSTKEVECIQEILDEVIKGLENDGLDYKVPIQGIMIETPAAVLICDELASIKEIEFLSIGTNDLEQFTMAMDRQNDRLSNFVDTEHKALIKMIDMTIKSAHSFGKRVGVCGELAADEKFLEKLVALGIDELSIVPNMILEIRKTIKELG